MTKLAKDIKKYLADRGVKVTVKEMQKRPQAYMRTISGGKRLSGGKGEV